MASTPTYRALGTAKTSSGSYSSGAGTLTFQAVVPSTAVVGDLLVLFFGGEAIAPSSSNWSYAASGWTFAGTAGNEPVLAMPVVGALYKMCASADIGATVTVTVTIPSSNGNTSPWGIVAGVIDYYATSGALDVSYAGTTYDTSSPVSTPGVTTTQPNDLVMTLFGTGNGGAFGSSPSHTGTLRLSGWQTPSADGYTSQIALIDTVQASAGATGTQSVTPTSDGNGIGLTLAFTAVQPPSAPTLGSPANGTYEDVSGTPTFTWTPNPNTGDGAESAMAFERMQSGGSAWSYWNQGTGAWQSSIVWNAWTTDSITFPSGSWSNGTTWQWSVATEEATYSLQGSFATASTVTGQAPPTANVTGPTGVQATASPIVSWMASLPSGASVTAYRIIIYTAAQVAASGFTPGSGSSLYDTGTVAYSSSSGSLIIPAGTIPNNTSCYAYVQVTETGGETSSWASSAFTVSFDAPAMPTVTAVTATDGVTGCPMVAVTVQGGDNLLTYNQSTLENGNTTGWTAGSNTTETASTTWAADGSYSLALNATAAGGVSANTPTGTGGYVVTAGQPFSVMAEFHDPTAGRSCTVGVTFYNSAGTAVGTYTSSAVAASTSGGAQALVQGTVPSTAATAAITVTGASLNASEVLYVDCIGHFPVTTSTWTRGGFVGGTTAELQYSSDGVTWTYPSTAQAPYVLGENQDVRGASAVSLPSASQSATVNDYEVVPGTVRYYRAIVSYGGNILVSPASAVASVTPATPSAWWFFDPTSPEGLCVSPNITAKTSTQTEQSMAMYAQQQALPSVQTNVVNGRDGTVTVETTSAAAYQAVQSLVTARRTLFMVSPFGDGYYVRLGPAGPSSSSTTGNQVAAGMLQPSPAANPYQTFQLQFVEVSKP